jgi:hypothetical protein
MAVWYRDPGTQDRAGSRKVCIWILPWTPCRKSTRESTRRILITTRRRRWDMEIDFKEPLSTGSRAREYPVYTSIPLRFSKAGKQRQRRVQNRIESFAFPSPAVTTHKSGAIHIKLSIFGFQTLRFILHHTCHSTIRHCPHRYI